VKPALLVREKPEAVIFGSSLAEIGFDPIDAAFTDQGRLRGYNFAFAGGAWDMERCAFSYALRHAPLRRAVVGIHPRAMPEVDCAKAWQGMDVSSQALLMSGNAFANSIRTVVEQRRARASHTREGRYLYARDAPGVSLRFREFFERDTKLRSQCTPQLLRKSPAREDVRALQPEPALDIAGLRSLIREARSSRVEVALVIYPQHSAWLELAFACGDPHVRWGNISALARAVAEESPEGSVSLWVFDNYDALRGERIVGGEPQFWQDPEHFNFELGTRMLAVIFGREREFGARVTPDNVDMLYRRLLAQREAFLAASDWFYRDLRTLFAPELAVR
jgi:hypothetical protein